ncbi:MULTISPECIES: hypothetical protein [unclassified Streptomyces]|uniref:hypothetical protein n=1 Tax=unclassified Streptomyces TaxID=2593676 RepID=UPI002DD87F47|nr:hypothetical protein [Streptomyces sp. NBC_01750]WSB00586.1 hypothetical protein OIE54_15515 [Streptomyces sp. NBC_01794]WSD35058.1 hypothetical protein OG966_26100 [Streptomyces sp. NBC_01750]
MAYLVVFDSEKWSVGQDALVSSLTTEWPAAAVRRRELDEGAEVRDVEWEVQRGDEEVEGYTHVDGRCIYLDGNIGLVADFALWYRKLVPKEIEVVFCDDGYSFDVAVDETSTREELVAAAEE